MGGFDPREAEFERELIRDRVRSLNQHRAAPSGTSLGQLYWTGGGGVTGNPGGCNTASATCIQPFLRESLESRNVVPAVVDALYKVSDRVTNPQWPISTVRASPINNSNAQLNVGLASISPCATTSPACYDPATRAYYFQELEVKHDMTGMSTVTKPC